MKRALMACFIFNLLFSCSFEPTLYIAGDSQAIGAEIYVDGQKVGIMNKSVYEGSTSKDPLIIEREKKLQDKSGIKPGDIFSAAEINISPGRHEIMFRNKDGKVLKNTLK